MKISIDTLPLWDAFRQGEICPFCRLENRLEELFIETYLGESVMEPDVRLEVNAKGFCPRHYGLLYAQKTSKLGLALMTHTHLKETVLVLDRQMEGIDNALGEGSSFLRRAAGAGEISAALLAAAQGAQKHARSCAVCERAEQHMERYFETAAHLWEHDAEFARLFNESRGFCLPHWGGQLKACAGGVMSKKRAEFVRTLNDIEKKSLSELEKDVEAFTRKFDYRNAGKPWGEGVRDALPRAINALEGYVVKPDSGSGS